MTLVSVVQLDQLTHELGIDIASLATNTGGETTGNSDTSSGGGSSSGDLSPGEGDTPGSEQAPRQINLSQQDRERLRRAAHILRQRLILRLWLDDHGLMDYAPK